ncbi:MAG TPA: MBL fold metallo-hydrolase [Acidobacteriota bacterium]|nr:MBL fold metallo-hydrolase [Acidobacteriota bacterium]
MKVSVLGSGSAGNCCYIASEKTAILVDAGFGIRSLQRRFKEAGLPLRQPDAILITHGHHDHVSGIPSLTKRWDVPIFINKGSRREASGLEAIPENRLVDFRSGFSIGDLDISAFAISHDANQPVGFRISCKNITGVVATDLGEITDDLKKHLEGCDWLVIESNHDEEMVKVGPYPWEVKRRVLSSKGHLSNRALARFFARDFDGRAHHIFLAHLSQNNNLPDLARSVASQALQDRLPLFRTLAAEVHLTHQSKASIVITL